MILIPIPALYKETIITPRTSRQIEAFWSFKADGPGQSLVLPDGRCDIIVRYNKDHADRPTAIITGPATQAYHVEFAAGDCWLGVRLRPSNGVMLWGQGIMSSENRVLRGQPALNRLPMLGEVSGKRLTIENLANVFKASISSKANKRVSHAVEMLHASGGRLNVEDLSTSVGYTSRQLNRTFRSNVGLTTKAYAQLVQFHRTLGLLKTQNLAISTAAFEGGYADQAHLTRAFKRFGGFTPSKIPDDVSLPSLFN